jgi:hypothetical protein
VGDPSGGPPVIVAVGRRLTRDPRALVAAVVAGLPKPDEPVDYHAGPLGGCLPGRAVPGAAELFRRIRSAATVD